MSTALSLIKILVAIPSIIGAIRDLVGWLEQQFGPNWPQRLADLQAAGKQWTDAQSTKERDDAAKALAAAFNSHK